MKIENGKWKMEIIRVTFPNNIPPKTAKFLIEEGLKRKSDFTCTVDFDKELDGENEYYISSEYGARAFFLIGMLTSVLLERTQ